MKKSFDEGISFTSKYVLQTVVVLLGFGLNLGPSGLFAGTAINDTSSVTAAAATWDNMWELGSQTLDKASTVGLTRTLAIIPITLALSVFTSKKSEYINGEFLLKKAFPMFILYFVIAFVIMTLAVSLGVDANVFLPFKELSKFFIILAMAAIGLHTDIVKLVKFGTKPIILGSTC